MAMQASLNTVRRFGGIFNGSRLSDKKSYYNMGLTRAGPVRLRSEPLAGAQPLILQPLIPLYEYITTFENV